MGQARCRETFAVLGLVTMRRENNGLGVRPETVNRNRSNEVSMPRLRSNINTVPVTVGLKLAGKWTNNRDHRAIVREISDHGVRIEYTDAVRRSASNDRRTIIARFTAEDQPGAVLCFPDEPATSTDDAPGVPDSAAPDPFVRDEPEASPVSTITEGVSLAVVEGWNVYRHEHDKIATVRDLDVAERAGLKNKRDIRTTINALADSKAIRIVHTGSETIVGDADDGSSPCAYAVTVNVPIGSGATRPVTEYHLDEAATLHVIMRLSTPKAVELQQAIVRVFLLVRQGRHEEAARVATGHKEAPGLGLEQILAHLSQLHEVGAITKRTEIDHRTAILRDHGIVDLTRPPALTYGQADEVAGAVRDMKPGEQAVVYMPISEDGLYTATKIAAMFGAEFSTVTVGDMARSIGIFGKPGYGIATPLLDNGRKVNESWKYNEAAKDIIVTALRDLVDRKRNKLPGDTREKMIADIGSKYRISSAAE